MRPIALNRKNALFAGHDLGAENWAMLATLIETCKLHGVNPEAYLADVLSKLVDNWTRPIGRTAASPSSPPGHGKPPETALVVPRREQRRRWPKSHAQLSNKRKPGAPKAPLTEHLRDAMLQ